MLHAQHETERAQTRLDAQKENQISGKAPQTGNKATGMLSQQIQRRTNTDSSIRKENTSNLMENMLMTAKSKAKKLN